MPKRKKAPELTFQQHIADLHGEQIEQMRRQLSLREANEKLLLVTGAGMDFIIVGPERQPLRESDLW